jgi:hypothetical protein
MTSAKSSRHTRKIVEPSVAIADGSAIALAQATADENQARSEYGGCRRLLRSEVPIDNMPSSNSRSCVRTMKAVASVPAS